MTARRLGIAGIAAALLVPLLVAPSPAAAAPQEAAATTCSTNPATPKRQFRAMWIASVTNIDWPTKASQTAPDRIAAQKAEYLRLARPGPAAQPQRRRRAGAPDRRRVLAVAVRALVASTSPGCAARTPAGTRSRSWSRSRTSATSSSTPGSTRTGSPCRERRRRRHRQARPRTTRSASTRTGRVAYPVNAAGSRLYYNPGIPEVRAVRADRDAGRRQAVRHRRRALRRLLLPVPGRRPGLPGRRDVRRSTAGASPTRPTGGATTSTC